MSDFPVSPKDKAPANLFPLAYFITFTTYGTWLHGDDRGSVDRTHNEFATPRLDPNQPRARAEARLSEIAFVLDPRQRRCIDCTIREVCDFRAWNLHAINVRTNHVHVVVEAQEQPERIMNQFKSWATRRLCEAGLFEKGIKLWTRHGSTRYLWEPKYIQKAIEYVRDRQDLSRSEPPSHS